MSNRKMLIVDDNADDREFIQLAFDESGIDNELIMLNDGAQALEYLLGQGGGPGHSRASFPKIILLDLKMPKVSGLELIKQVRANPRTKLMPIIVFSSSSEEKDILASYQLGANSYIRKPVDANLFMDTVKCIGTYWLNFNCHPEDLE